VGVPTIKTGPMTVEEFYSFTDTRPDEEKWELIDGEPVLNASPSPIHQWIVGNLIVALRNRARALGDVSWAVLPGLGVRVSDVNRPEPDVLIIPRAGDSLDPLGRDRSDVMVAFEILSPSTEDRDLRWKRTAYTSLPILTHYVIIAQDRIEVVVFARSADFAERRILSLAESLDLPGLGISLPLAEIYHDTDWVRARRW
jgi:Uma2 family endonuclease